MKLVVKYTFPEVKQYIWTLNMQMRDLPHANFDFYTIAQEYFMWL